MVEVGGSFESLENVATSTFAAAWRRAVTLHGGAPFLVFEGPDAATTEWTYTEFDHVVGRAAFTLATFGVGQGSSGHLALTNFDTERLRIITESGIRVVSNQVQYSLVDRRPEAAMAAYCRDHAITLLTYGTVLGGLLSEKFLGRPQPGRAELDTASLQKYSNMIAAWGGWPLFQELLATLKTIADKHRVSIANIGVRYILDRPQVAGVIVGTRLGVAEHIADNARVFSFALDADDLSSIDAVLAKSRDLLKSIGDCGAEYR